MASHPWVSSSKGGEDCRPRHWLSAEFDYSTAELPPAIQARLIAVWSWLPNPLAIGCHRSI
ncbi:MAG: hypothetical protein ACK53L_00040, partial [Pirellulaceae bacterium]